VAAKNKWIAYRREGIGDRVVRLVFFPYAGKGATGYRELADQFAEDIEPVLVQTPGREARLAEPAVSVMDDLVAALAAELRSLLTEPFAFFGHSMGSLVAFELARKLRTDAADLPGPVHLFVSAERAPHLIEPPAVTNDRLTDAEFLADPMRVRPDSPLRTDPMFAELMLPTYRADSLLVERYRCGTDATVDCPISAFVGEYDEIVPPDSVAEWKWHTTAAFRLRLLPGGDDAFFRPEAAAMITDAVQSDLAAG
jgi:medium-chain acyl-[acyl-carrier-protein] hydrolase